MAADGILNANMGVNLKGAAIGNGWIDVRHQYPSFLDYAVKHGLLEEGSDVGTFMMLCAPGTDGSSRTIKRASRRSTNAWNIWIALLAAKVPWNRLRSTTVRAF